MQDEDLIKKQNGGLTRLGVAKEYMKDHNKKAKGNKEMKRITIQQALEYVEPILFEYRMRQLKGEEQKI